MIKPQARTTTALGLRRVRGIQVALAPLAVFMFFGGSAYAECNIEQARLIKRLKDEVISFKKHKRKPYQDKDIKNYLLPTYKQLIRIVKSCQGGVEIVYRRTLLLEAGEFSLQLYEWDAAYAFCEEYLGLAEIQEKDRLRGEQCLHNAENRSAPILPSPDPPPVSPKPPEVAKPQASQGTSPNCAPIAALPPEPKRCPECQTCPPQSEALPILSMREVYQCEQLKQLDPAVACYRRILMEHTNSESGAAERISERIRSDVALTWNNSRSRNDAMWGAGLALWMASYVPALIFSGIYIAKPPGFTATTSDTLPPTVYGLLAIPLGGPFFSGSLFAASDFVTNDEKLRYSLPWMLASGVPQIVGFALFVSGARTLRPKKPGSDMAMRGPIPFLLTPQVTRTFTGLTVSFNH